jgi:hypothetical protein
VDEYRLKVGLGVLGIGGLGRCSDTGERSSENERRVVLDLRVDNKGRDSPAKGDVGE